MRIDRLKLKKLINTRDLGGIPTKDGRQIVSGKLFRSGKLYNLPLKTLAQLKEMGISTVIDMRIETEINEYPDSIPEGVTYIKLPILCTATTGITHDKKMFHTMVTESKRIKKEFGNADNYMKSMYSIILFSEESRATLRKFFDILIEEDGGVLWHCSAGKDRAGIGAMLIEGLLGVSDELIIADYVASQRLQRKKRIWQKVGLWIVPVPPRLRRILLVMMNAKRLYIESALAEINEKYGNITNYCKDALGLTDDQVNLLRKKYIV
jgi:protein-tyrosine phosphatase